MILIIYVEHRFPKSFKFSHWLKKGFAARAQNHWPRSDSTTISGGEQQPQQRTFVSDAIIPQLRERLISEHRIDKVDIVQTWIIIMIENNIYDYYM